MSDSKLKSDDKPTPKPVVLELRNVTFATRAENSLRLRNAELMLREGEVAILDIDQSRNVRDAVSMIQGLQQPIEGEVLFQGEDWQGEDFDRHFRMRSRIGRVFEDRAWIQNFNVRDNLTLASRHHRIAPANINQQVESWVERFDVPKIAHKRPAFVDPTVLQVYQWIRALLCKPKLMILERPMNRVPSGKLPKLIEAINEVRGHGAAVIWFTTGAGNLGTALDAPRIDYQWIGGELRKVSGGSVDE